MPQPWIHSHKSCCPGDINIRQRTPIFRNCPHTPALELENRSKRSRQTSEHFARTSRQSCVPLHIGGGQAFHGRNRELRTYEPRARLPRSEMQKKLLDRHLLRNAGSCTDFLHPVVELSLDVPVFDHVALSMHIATYL